MAKITNLIRLSDEYNIDPNVLDEMGVLNPTLAADILVFVDPLLLSKSKHSLFNKEATTEFDNYFGLIIKLLSASKEKGDKPWKAAFKKLSFPEYGWTKLGYGGETGAGSGELTTSALLESASQVIGFGVEDPDLFTALSVFEENIGPDRISDMTCHIISDQIVKFNEMLAIQLGVVTKEYNFRLKNGGVIKGKLIENKFIKDNGPLLLVPKDILRDLPLAADWSDITRSIKDNNDMREDLSSYVTNIWQRRTKDQKSISKAYYMENKERFEEFIRFLRMTADTPYDFDKDPRGEIFWRNLTHELLHHHKFGTVNFSADPAEKVRECAIQTIDNFRFLIEKRRLSSELYSDGKPRLEKSAQKLFFCVAYAFCKANNIDITPEAETDYGPVDFKFSTGFKERHLVEIKLSKNNLEKGLTKQIKKYAEAEETYSATYLIIDMGDSTLKIQKVIALQKKLLKEGKWAPDIEVVDGTLQKSASV